MWFYRLYIFFYKTFNQVNMSVQLKTEDVLLQIRSKLQSDDIKLWLEPYYFEGIGPSDEEIQVIWIIFRFF